MSDTTSASPVRYNRYEHSKFDLVVCGGGLAGFCSAVLAARQGLAVALVQDRPVLGGNSSSEIRVPVHGAGTYWPWAIESGLLAEVLDEERFRNPEPVHEGSTSSTWDLVLYEWAAREKTLTLFLSTSVRGVELDAAVPTPRIVSVRCSQLGTEKEFALQADCFVDATGDGTIGALAGCRWRIGREARSEHDEPSAPERADDVCQGSTIQFRTRDFGRPVPFHAPDWAFNYPTEESLYWRHHDDPRGGYWWIEIGHPFDMIADNEKVHHELLSRVLGIFDHIKNHCPDRARAANLTLDWVGQVPGKRESRRIMGPHLLTENDIRARRLFDDRVAYGGWFLDQHVKGGLLAANEKPEQSAFNFDQKDLQQVPVYSIPLSSLRAAGVSNLFLAGRDLSATHMALMSARVMGTCAVMGAATGAAAAICKRTGRSPDALTPEDIAAVQQLLLREDCYVPHVANSDPADLARQARASATSASPLILRPMGDAEADWLELTYPTECIVPITAGRVEAAELAIDNRTGGPVELTLTLRRRPTDIWDATGEQEVGRCTASAPPGRSTVRFEPGVAVEPGLYGVKLAAAPGVFWAKAMPQPGTAAAALRKSGKWRFEGIRGNWRALALALTPASQPFEASNVVNGVARPERGPNLWMSDPARPMPQSLTLELASAADVAEVRLTFDNNLGRGIRNSPGNFVAPELVRDYAVELRTGGKWKAVVTETVNRRRHRVHRFDAVRADAIRLTVTATNGAPEARVYEVRAYGR